MSFFLGACFLIVLVIGGVAYLMFRRRRWVALGVAGASLVGLLAWFLHPVCAPLTPDVVALISPSIEARTETGLIGQRIFQQRDGGWYHCKVWIARGWSF